jgi:hypothetical protein
MTERPWRPWEQAAKRRGRALKIAVVSQTRTPSDATAAASQTAQDAAAETPASRLEITEATKRCLAASPRLGEEAILKAVSVDLGKHVPRGPFRNILKQIRKPKLGRPRLL